MGIGRLQYTRQMKPMVDGESGAVAAEAAIGLPVLLGTLFVSMQLLYFCFRFLSFQFAVAEVTRQTFTLNSAQRGNRGWQAYFEENLREQTEKFNMNPEQNIQIAFSNPACSNGWLCSLSAQPGDTFSVVAIVTEPIFAQNIGGITLPEITFSTRAVATIQMRETEGQTTEN
jgi:hypothetical protein